MNNTIRTTLQQGVINYKDTEWSLNTYIIKRNVQELITEDDIRDLIENAIDTLENECMSKEFCYLKTGFAFLHYGTRGVDLSIWHMGNWGDTYELYNCSWYCYARNISNMELLNSSEPILSQYEIKWLIKELAVCAEILNKIDVPESFRPMYINACNNTLCSI